MAWSFNFTLISDGNLGNALCALRPHEEPTAVQLHLLLTLPCLVIQRHARLVVGAYQ
jgi:hypothetical protein